MVSSSLRKFAVAAVVLCASAAPAFADGRIIIDEENDSIGSFSDHHYTQGARFAWLSDALASGSSWNAPFSWLSAIAPIFDANADSARRVDLALGQSMFTPTNLRLVNPDPNDRPYAGWLYTGASLLQQSAMSGGHMLEDFEVELGVVGPAALARQIQNGVHSLIADHQAEGWGYQLRNEPGLVLNYDRKWRFEGSLGDGFSVDVVPELGASLGNVLTYGQAGAMLRFGQNSEVDYGPSHIQPSLSGTDWFDTAAISSTAVGWYLYGGVQGRLVGRNIFLDGNTFATSRSIAKRAGVFDMTGGGSIYWSHHIKLDINFTQRSAEYVGQGSPDRYGTVTISFGI